MQERRSMKRLVEDVETELEIYNVGGPRGISFKEAHIGRRNNHSRVVAVGIRNRRGSFVFLTAEQRERARATL